MSGLSVKDDENEEEEEEEQGRVRVANIRMPEDESYMQGWATGVAQPIKWLFTFLVRK